MGTGEDASQVVGGTVGRSSGVLVKQPQALLWGELRLTQEFSGVTAGDAWRTMWGVRDQTLVGCMHSKSPTRCVIVLVSHRTFKFALEICIC